MRKLLILGASGSIGSQTLDVIITYNLYELVAVTVGNRFNAVDEIIAKFPTVKFVTLKDPKVAKEYQIKYPNVTFYSGNDGLLEIIENSGADVVVNALTGFAGLLPSIKTLEKNKILCLANKESLVVGGEFINKLLKDGHGKLYPIDSEHVAIAKCLYGKNIDDVEKILITASGGPFFDLDSSKFSEIKVEDALKHPNWSMGKKITIDSSTMMNKAFEITEAYYLFGVPKEKIFPLVDRKSHVHSLVKFKNGEVRLQVGPSDMRIPIYYALTFGKCDNGEKFDDVEINTYDKYSFKEMDYEKFPLINYGKFIIDKKGNMGAIINAANEECVYAFLNFNINYVDIKNIIDKIVNVYPYIKDPSLEEIIKTDLEVRNLVNEMIKNK
ncbi:MAG: 1-deoxy-D-xylulose-5-phosphate reductoisomerase [Bacilli bacterium]|nr:1-deoxy-D-xylulose-5-phosphate reductoisomerase [Bacilli bacterium]